MDRRRTYKLCEGRKQILFTEALTSHAGDDFTTCAELNLLGANAKVLPSDGWKVVYADSEEVDAEDGSGDKVLDMHPDTFWHTQWDAAKPKHPHHLVIDMGREETVAGLRYLPRQDSGNGNIRDFRLYLSATPFPGL